MEYGLIGARLGHSFSKPIHEALNPNASYELCPLPEEQQARDFLAARAFSGINVTIPYKRLVMEYCDEIAPSAKAIGAVNTVTNRNGRLCGYNTDYDGFLEMARSAHIDFEGRRVLILGTGGTAHTVHAAVAAQGAAHVHHASHSGTHGALTYEQAIEQGGSFDILINTTPVGMYPDCDASPVDLKDFPCLGGVLDVVYNPLKTELLCRAKERGIPHAGGLRMLVAQAFYAQQYFQDKTLERAQMDDIYRRLVEDRANLILIGMPSCGKSTVGKLCAEMLGKRFIDADEALEQRTGKRISEILRPGTEAAFRDLEEQVLADLAKEGGCVIATGGGAVLRGQNMRRLRRGGVLIWLNRALEALTPGGARPLSATPEALQEQWRVRRPLYEAAAHASVNNDASAQETAQKVKEIFHEILNREWP